MKSLRKSGGFTGIQLAEYLSITPQFYYSIENGNRTLTQEYLEKLSDFFSVTVDYILGRNDSNVEHVEELPKDLRTMIKDAKDLTPDQRKLISGIIKELKETGKR